VQGHQGRIRTVLRISLSVVRAAGAAKVDVETILSRWSSLAVLLAMVALYYLFLLSNGTFQLFAPELLDKAFNNMLVHLLRGEFTVDREAIDFEAFTRDGKTYAYFGIFPAVLRIFAIPFADLTRAQLARLSCLIAVVLFVALQLRVLLIVHQSVPAASRRPEFLTVMVAAAVLSGPQLYILSSAYIFVEPILWSAAMGAGFNLIIVRTTFGGKSLRGRDLVLLAALAGLAINTRPSVGVALYLGTILLVAWAAWLRYAPDRHAQQFAGKATCLSSTILLPIAILALAAVVVSFINFERWGDVFTFVDYHYYDRRLTTYLNLVEVLDKYGDFNVKRIWIGALYYATGIPYLFKAVPPFADFLHARFLNLEFPPSTPVLTNPLTVILAGIGLYRVWWKPGLSTPQLAVLRLALLGHAAAVLLILAAMWLSIRYRFDFAPFMILAALVGYGSVSITLTELPEFRQKRVLIASIGLCLLGILSSHYMLLIQKVQNFSLPIDVRLTLLPFAPFLHPLFDR
jgi:hypothetical protein